MGKPVKQFIGGTVLVGTGLLTGQPWLVRGGIYLLADTARDAIRKPPDLSIRARNLGDNITDPMASLPVVYGTMRLGVHRVFMESTDEQLEGEPPHIVEESGKYLWIGALA